MKITITLILIFTAFFLNAATYYVDSSGGNDENDGLSPAAAWKTIDKVNSTTLVAGDSVLFKRGEIFRGNLIPQSGSPLDYITYGAYGTGNKPKIFGSFQRNSQTDWINEGGNIWATSQAAVNLMNPELLPNPDFNNDLSYWHKWDNTLRGASSELSITTVEDEYYSSPGGIKLDCTDNGVVGSDLQIYTNSWAIKEFKWYKLSFYAKATKDFVINPGQILLMKVDPPYSNYFSSYYAKPIIVTNSWHLFEIYFKSNVTANDCRLTFYLGGIIPDRSVFYLDTFSLKECDNDPEFLTEDVGNIILNDESFCGIKIWGENELDLQGEFWYDPNNEHLKMYSTINPANYYSHIELARSKSIINVIDKSFIKFENLDLRYGGNHGINCINTHHIWIINVDISYIGGGTIEWSINHDRFGNGIQFWNAAHDNVVEQCTFSQIYDAAITPQGIDSVGFETYNLFFRNNIVINCEYSFEFWETGKNISVHDIYFENNTCINAGGGWGHNQRPDPNGTHLMFYKNDAQTFDFYIRNNIFYNSTDQGIRWYNSSNLNDIILDYNCWYESKGPIAMISDNDYDYLTQWETYKTASGHDHNSIASNPLLESDFSLQPTSPCIGSGMVLAYVPDDFYGEPRYSNSGYDIGAIDAKNFLTKENIVICAGGSYQGWAVPGQYQRVFLSISGRDSFVVTNLSFYPSVEPEILVYGDTLKSSGAFQKYQWFNETKEIPGAIFPEYIITKSGNYSLAVTDVNGCIGTSEVIKVFYSLNKHFLSPNYNYSVIPNPCNGVFSLWMESKTGVKLIIKLINASGQLVETRKIDSANTCQTEQFDVKHLSKGIYYLSISSGAYKTMEKILVQ